MIEPMKYLNMSMIFFLRISLIMALKFAVLTSVMIRSMNLSTSTGNKQAKFSVKSTSQANL